MTTSTVGPTPTIQGRQTPAPTARSSAPEVVAEALPGILWRNVILMSLVHLGAATAIVYLAAIHFSWWTLGFAAAWGICCGLSITGGYHRLFSHATYKASAPLRLFYLLFGAASAQDSAMKWSADHRRHHAFTDKDRDPYSVERGFFWAHMGWIMCRPLEKDGSSFVRDLAQDKLVRLQHRFYWPLALLIGFVVPAAIASAWGDALGGFLVAGCLRLTVQWHATFSVNSFAHLIGERPYAHDSSARDSMLVAFMTLGEGYHNFHHRFQHDYRNGVHWYQFDPTKWWIWSASRVGLAKGLRRVSRERLQAARDAASAAAGRVQRQPGTS